MPDDSIGNEGADQILQALEKNTTIKAIDLTGTDFSLPPSTSHFSPPVYRLPATTGNCIEPKAKVRARLIALCRDKSIMIRI